MQYDCLVICFFMPFESTYNNWLLDLNDFLVRLLQLSWLLRSPDPKTTNNMATISAIGILPLSHDLANSNHYNTNASVCNTPRAYKINYLLVHFTHDACECDPALDNYTYVFKHR
jgi:uncharacterized protein with ParB-like and HNH nuclease domain